MKYNKLKSVSDNLKKYDYLAKDNDFIQVTEWANGEGYNIDINDQSYNFTLGQLEAINYLTKSLDYNDK
jgi:hypothetical protein